MFSADDHISLAEDIFYERFPESMKDQAPRVVYDDGAWTLAIGGKAFLPREFTAVLMQYDPLDGLEHRTTSTRGCASSSPTASTASWRSPTRCSASWAGPTRTSASAASASTTSTSPSCRSSPSGRFYGVGMINWWDGDGCRKTLTEMKDLGLKTFWLPLKPGKDDDGKPIDYNSPAMYPVWEAIEESGLPVAHHIGESPLGSPCADNSVLIGMVHNVAPFREMFGRYVFGGILDRHPGLTVGWFEGGINWVPAALQDAEHLYASLQHMADHAIEQDVAALLGPPHVRVVHGRPARARA